MIRFVCRQPDAPDGQCWLVMAEAGVAAGPGGGPLFLIESSHYSATKAREALETLETDDGGSHGDREA